MEEEKLDNIDIRELARKSTTKAEVYKVLTTTGGIYLPPVDQINSDFIRDILAGDKLVSHSSYCSVHRVKQSQNYWSSTYRRIENPRGVRVCKSTLQHSKVHAWLRIREIFFKKVDMQRW